MHICAYIFKFVHVEKCVACSPRYCHGNLDYLCSCPGSLARASCHVTRCWPQLPPFESLLHVAAIFRFRFFFVFCVSVCVLYFFDNGFGFQLSASAAFVQFFWRRLLVLMDRWIPCSSILSGRQAGSSSNFSPQRPHFEALFGTLSLQLQLFPSTCGRVCRCVAGKVFLFWHVPGQNVFICECCVYIDSISLHIHVYICMHVACGMWRICMYMWAGKQRAQVGLQGVC